MKRIIYLIAALIIVPLLALQSVPHAAPVAAADNAIPVVIELSSIGDEEQLARRAEEVKKRGFVASVSAGLDAVDGQYLKGLAESGFEIMGPVPWQENDTYARQLDDTLAAKQALEAACGQPVAGFSPTGSRFNRGNEHTYAVLEAIGAKYILQSARYEKLPASALEPYPVPGYSFYCIPMQSRGLYNPAAGSFDQTVLAMSGSN